MNNNKIINWLLAGDVSIQFQTYRDLLGKHKAELQERIEMEGWGAQYLAEQKPNGHWGLSYYQPKWTSTHYTLLELRNLNFPKSNERIKLVIDEVLRDGRGEDGGINPSVTVAQSDVCINGMFLNFASYFGTHKEKLIPLVDFILSQNMNDGGYNCMLNRSGAIHSSMHTTISTLEGFTQYKNAGYTYRIDEIKKSTLLAQEFLLMHRFFKSDRTGKIINKDFLKMPHPSRWRYDILRALDYFRYAKVKWDERMTDAIQVLLKKRNKDGTWNANAKHPGKVHFEMEKAGMPSRWNTLKALRILQFYKIV
jgi:hypothetical protein